MIFDFLEDRLRSTVLLNIVFFFTIIDKEMAFFKRKWYVNARTHRGEIYILKKKKKNSCSIYQKIRTILYHAPVISNFYPWVM